MAEVWLVGSGVVGRRVSRFLGHLHPSSLDPRSPTLDAVQPGDVAVLVSGGPHAPAAADLIRRGVAVVTAGDDLSDCRNLLDLEDLALSAGVPLVIGAAMSPGLSGLIVRSLVDSLTSCSEIHIAFHGTAGPACARSYHRSLSGQSVVVREGAMRTAPGGSGRELLWFPEPVGPMDCYLAEIASPLLLHRSLPNVDRVTVRRSARRRDRVTARLPMLRSPHSEGGVGALRVEVRGIDADGRRRSMVQGVAEQVGTASAAVAATFVEAVVAGALPPGVSLAGDENVADLRLLHRVIERGVRLQEYCGGSGE